MDSVAHSEVSFAMATVEMYDVYVDVSLELTILVFLL